MDTPAVLAHGISVQGTEGTVYGPLDIEIPTTGLIVLAGRGGSGRTALALTLSGRMKPSSGTLTVLGETKPANIRPKVAIAGVAVIDELDRDVTIKAILREHRAWSTKWAFWTPRIDPQYYEQLCKPIFGDRPLPPMSAYISQIPALDRILLRIALAMNPAHKTPIEMLVMDDLEQVREEPDRQQLIDTLARLSQTIPVVVNAVNPLPGYPHINLHTDGAYIRSAKEQQ
ncbi:MAG: hypothetical protein Q4A92_01340 [Corynebacterium sp.]|nr:hypothetical protein [Corynebacterium sp.]